MAKLLLSAATALLLLFFLSPPPPTTATSTTVVDYQGNPVEAGAEYRLFFAGTGYFFGGLTMFTKPPHPMCPQFVGVSPFPSDPGIPLKFLPSDASQKTISLSSNLNIAFSGPTRCGDGGVWKLTAEEATGNLYVTTGGVIGNPGADSTVGNWFTIEKSEEEQPLPYKIRYCPGVSEKGNEVVCGDLVLPYDDLNIWLGINQTPADPFRVSFIKV